MAVRARAHTSLCIKYRDGRISAFCFVAIFAHSWFHTFVAKPLSPAFLCSRIDISLDLSQFLYVRGSPFVVSHTYHWHLPNKFFSNWPTDDAFRNPEFTCLLHFYFHQFNFDQMQIWMYWCISSRNWMATKRQRWNNNNNNNGSSEWKICETRTLAVLRSVSRSIVLFACVPRAPSIDIGPIVNFFFFSSSSFSHLCSIRIRTNRVHTCITENSSPCVYWNEQQNGNRFFIGNR